MAHLTLPSGREPEKRNPFEEWVSRNHDAISRLDIQPLPPLFPGTQRPPLFSAQTMAPERERSDPLGLRDLFSSPPISEQVRTLQERTTELESRVTEARGKRNQALEAIREKSETIEAASSRLSAAEGEIVALRRQVEQLAPSAAAWYALKAEIARRQLLGDDYHADEREVWIDYTSDNSLNVN